MEAAVVVFAKKSTSCKIQIEGHIYLKIKGLLYVPTSAFKKKQSYY